MSATPQQIYSYHSANVRRISKALEKVGLNIREAVSKENHITIKSLLPLYMLLLAALAECRLKKLLFEPNAFADVERHRIILRVRGNGREQKRTQFEQWKEVINLAFEKHFAVLTSDFSTHLPADDLSKYNELINLLETDLKPIIEIRNKLAHGQWEYPLNSSGNNISQDFKNSIDSENLLSLQFKEALISSLINIVNDLAVSKPTFDRDFSKHYNHILQTKINLRLRSYPKYVNSLVEKKIRGKQEKGKRESEVKNFKSYINKLINKLCIFIRQRFTSLLLPILF